MNANGTIAAKPREPGRSGDRRAAAWIGGLYIVGTVGMVIGSVVTSPILSGSAYLAQVAGEPSRLALGALLLLVAGLALALVPVVFWPIGRRYNETLAVGYVVFRGALEAIFYIVAALGWLLLIALSGQAGAGPLAGFVRTIQTVIWDQVIAIPFVIGALMFYVLLYTSRLLPRWLSTWGIAGAALYLLAPLGSMFELSIGILMAPLALQEMVMAVWLIAKGFNRPASEVAPADAMSSWRAAEPSTVPAT